MRIEELVDLGDDVVFAHARPQHFIDDVVGTIDHCGRAIEKCDFVGRFDFTRAQHDLLAVFDLDPGLLELEHHWRLNDVDADRHFGDACRLEN